MAVTETKTRADATAIIRGLNDDLTRELQAIVRYTQFAATIHGPYRLQLADLFRREINDELSHVHFLADKIDALGGELSMFVPPIESSREPREMLRLIEKAEHEDVETYARRAAEAEAFGDIGLKVQLESIVLDETRHLEEIRKIQASWT